MNIAETIKDKYNNSVRLQAIVTVCEDFKINRIENHHGVTYDFIDDSVLIIKTSDIYPKGFAIVTKNKRV